MPRIILDTDPGVDDALAILLAIASPEVQLEAITTVSGNVPVEDTTRNALNLLEMAGQPGIPVARGSARPLMREAVYADYVHGQNGLGGVQLPAPGIKPVPQHAVDLIIEKIMDAPGEMTLVAIGPLTNLALALRTEPRIAQNVREVVIMGGAVRVPGNTTPAAEFNIYVDPQAAQIVLHGGWPIRLVSLDVTNITLLQREQVDLLARSNSPVPSFIKRLLDFSFDVFGPASYEGSTGFQMHDPLALAAAFQPDLITWESCYVDVELSGTLTLGETVGYFPNINMPDAPSIHAPNALVSIAVDSNQFIQLFMKRIEAYYYTGGA